MGTVRTTVDGLWFPEGPRWHDGALWCSDIHGHRVLRIEPEYARVSSLVSNLMGASRLGGPDRRTLYICVAAEYQREAVLRQPLGRIVALEVEVAGSGRP